MLTAALVSARARAARARGLPLPSRSMSSVVSALRGGRASSGSVPRMGRAAAGRVGLGRTWCPGEACFFDAHRNRPLWCNLTARSITWHRIFVEQNRTILKYARNHNLIGMLAYAEKHVETLNSTNWQTIFTVIGTTKTLTPSKPVYFKNDAAFKRLLEVFEHKIGKYGSQWLRTRSISSIVHAFGVMGVASSVLLEAVHGVAGERIIREGQPIEIARTAYGLGKLGDRSLRDAHDGGFLKLLEHEGGVQRLVQEGELRHLANATWAMATLRKHAPVLCKAIGTEEIAERIVSGKVVDISMILWAMAKFQYRVPVLCGLVETKEVARRIFEEGDTKEIVTVLYAMAKLGYSAPVLVSEMEKNELFFNRLVNFESCKGNDNQAFQDVSQTMWSLASLDHEAPVFVSKFESSEFVNWLPQANHANRISQIFWSLEKLKYDCPRIVSSITKNLDAICEDKKSTPKDIADLAHAYAHFGCVEDGVFEVLSTKALRLEGANHLSRTLWAFAVSGKVKKHEALVRRLWKRALSAARREFEGANNDEWWRTLEIVRLYAKAEGVDLVAEGGEEEDAVILKLEAASKSKAREPSSFEDEVVAELTELGYEGFERAVSPFDDEEGGEIFKIDIAWKDEKVALELYESRSFLKAAKGADAEGKIDEHPKLDGPTTAKRRLLEGLGWKHSSLSYLNNVERETMTTDERRKMWEDVLGTNGLVAKK